MRKIIDLGSHFGDTFEPTLQLLDEDHTEGHEKVASEAWDYIKDVKPKEGHRYILVIAMGAGEYYGSNRNADFFPEKDLKLSYKNFETQFDSEGKINGGALIYKHHKNKLAKGHPWFGTVVKSFWNDHMKRIELLLDVHADKAADVIAKIDRGDPISVSMGVRIPYDECSECGNKAKKTKDYCYHLKYQLRKILPNGKKVYAINGNYDYNIHKKPLNFFDISFVFRPADEQGYMLKKVASFGNMQHAYSFDDTSSAAAYEKFAELEEKVSELRKLSDISKTIEGHPVVSSDSSGELKAIKSFTPALEKVVSQMKPLDGDKISLMAKYPLNEVLSTLAKSNIMLTTPEFMSLVVTKLTGIKVSPEALLPLAEAQSEIFNDLANDPDLLEEYSKYDMFKEVPANEKIAEIYSDISESRDISESGFLKKAGTDISRSVLGLQDSTNPWGDGKGMLHTETITDPKTGRKMTVNMDAIEDARFTRDTSSVLKAVGGAGLLAGVHFLMRDSAKPLVRGASSLAGIASLALGAYGLKNAVIRNKSTGYHTTDQGTLVPMEVSGIVKKSAVLPYANEKLRRLFNSPTSVLGSATAAPLLGTYALNKHYEGKLNDGTAGSYRSELGRKIDTAGKHSYNHPYLVGGAGVVAAGTGLALGDKLRKAVFKKYL